MWAVVHPGGRQECRPGPWNFRGTGMEGPWNWRGTQADARGRPCPPPRRGVELAWNALSALGAHPWMCRGTRAQRRGIVVDVICICRGTCAQGRGTAVELGRRPRIGVPWNCRGTLVGLVGKKLRSRSPVAVSCAGVALATAMGHGCGRAVEPARNEQGGRAGGVDEPWTFRGTDVDIRSRTQSSGRDPGARRSLSAAPPIYATPSAP